jgi:hypothetical protein
MDDDGAESALAEAFGQAVVERVGVQRAFLVVAGYRGSQAVVASPLQMPAKDGALQVSPFEAMQVGRVGQDLGDDSPAGLGSKYHLLVDRHGVPLAACLSAANTHDSMLLEAVVDAVPPVKGPRGRPRQRPVKLHLACALICLKALNQSAEGLRTRPDSPARSSRAGALRSAARRSAAAS